MTDGLNVNYCFHRLSYSTANYTIIGTILCRIIASDHRSRETLIIMYTTHRQMCARRKANVQGHRRDPSLICKCTPIIYRSLFTHTHTHVYTHAPICINKYIIYVYDLQCRSSGPQSIQYTVSLAVPAIRYRFSVGVRVQSRPNRMII